MIVPSLMPGSAFVSTTTLCGPLPVVLELAGTDAVQLPLLLLIEREPPLPAAATLPAVGATFIAPDAPACDADCGGAAEPALPEFVPFEVGPVPLPAVDAVRGDVEPAALALGTAVPAGATLDCIAVVPAPAALDSVESIAGAELQAAQSEGANATTLTE